MSGLHTTTATTAKMEPQPVIPLPTTDHNHNGEIPDPQQLPRSTSTPIPHPTASVRPQVHNIYLYNIPMNKKWRQVKTLLMNFVPDSTILHIQVFEDTRSALVSLNDHNCAEITLSQLDGFNWEGFILSATDENYDIEDEYQASSSSPPSSPGFKYFVPQNPFQFYQGPPVGPSGGAAPVTGASVSPSALNSNNGPVQMMRYYGPVGFPPPLPPLPLQQQQQQQPHQSHQHAPPMSSTFIPAPLPQSSQFNPYYAYHQSPYNYDPSHRSSQPDQYQYHPHQYQYIPPPSTSSQNNFTTLPSTSTTAATTTASSTTSSSSPTLNFKLPTYISQSQSHSNSTSAYQSPTISSRQITSLHQYPYKAITDFHHYNSMKSHSSSPGIRAPSYRSSSLDQSGPIPDRTRLFIGNIPYSVEWRELKDALRQAGTDILRVEIPIEKDGNSRGFAIATFQSEAGAYRAIDIFDGKDFMGRNLTVRFDRFPKRLSEVSVVKYYEENPDPLEKAADITTTNTICQNDFKVVDGLDETSFNTEDDKKFEDEARNLIESLSLSN